MWIQQIQPTAFRDYINNSLLQAGLVPNIQLPRASTPVPGTIQLLAPPNRGQIVHSAPDSGTPRLDAWDDVNASISTSSASDGYMLIDPNSGVRMACMRETHYHQARWPAQTDWDSSWRQSSERKGKGKGKWPPSSSSRSSRAIQDEYKWDDKRHRWYKI